MRKISLLVLLFLLSIAVTSAKDIGNVTMPDMLNVGDNSLGLNGAGIRSKFVFELYVAGLYLSAASNNAETVVSSNTTMALRLHIISSKITAEKMVKATRKGFVKATGDNTTPIESEIAQFLSVLGNKIENGDVFEFMYTPENGTAVYKNSTLQTTISTLTFKQALWGIWLGDKPAQGQLKTALMSG